MTTSLGQYIILGLWPNHFGNGQTFLQLMLYFTLLGKQALSILHETIASLLLHALCLAYLQAVLS